MNNYTWLLSPPLAFLIVFMAALLLSVLLSRLSFKVKRSKEDDSSKAYACGEEITGHRVQVDYGQFFPFAFFFTILHVIALIVATVPVETISSFSIAVIYLLGGVTGLLILFRR